MAKKSKEKLQLQAGGFLEYAKVSGKLDEKTRNEISKVLGLESPRIIDFFEWLHNKFSKKIDISDTGKINEILKKKNIDFETIRQEYVDYLRKIRCLKEKTSIKNDDELICSMLLKEKYSDDEINSSISNFQYIEQGYSNLEVLKIIFENFPDIKYEDLNYLFSILNLNTSKFKRLELILEKIPNIDIDSFFRFMGSQSLEYYFKDLKLIKKYLEKHKKFYGGGQNTFGNCANAHVLQLITNKYKNVKYEDLKPLICMIFDIRLDEEKYPLIDIILEHYPNISLSDLNILYKNMLKTSRDGFFDVKILEVIFSQYPEITIEELKSLKDVIKIANPNTLKVIFSHYPKITLEELRLWKDIIDVVYADNLDTIFNHYPKITIEGLRLWKDVIKIANPNTLKVIFCYYPEITIEKLKSLKDVIKIANSNTLKVIFSQYPKITIEELKSLKDVIKIANSDNLEIIFNEFGEFTLEELKSLNKGILSRIKLPKKLLFKESNHKGYLMFIGNIIDTDYYCDKKSRMIEKVVTLSFEQAENYVEIFKMFDDSISMDIQRIKDELIDELLKSDNPQKIAEKIINIFEKNNLPLTGKIFKVFELLYPIEKIKNNLHPASGFGILGSPLLNDYINKGNELGVYELIYKDLMNIAIKSGERSLRKYLKTFVGSEKLLKKFENIVSSDGFDGSDPHCLENKLEEDEQTKLLYLFRRISVLYNRYFGGEINEGNSIENKNYGESTVVDNQLVEFYKDIKKGFNLRDGKSIYDRLKTLLYVNGLKYHSPEDVIEQMDKSKKDAHERGLNLYNQAKGGKIKFPKHAFLKGVEEDAFSKIINRGITSREYLGGGEDGKVSGNVGGSGAGSDYTPFDIDGFYVDKLIHSNYGLVNLVVNTDRGNFVDTTVYNNSGGLSRYKENQYELFKTGFVNKNHYGIRTGIPTTEIDYIIYRGSFDRTEKVFVKTEEHSEGEYVITFSKYQNMCYEIARNGYYIPITDEEGNIKFTPEMYHKIRAGFNFMEYYDGYDVELKDGKYVSCEGDNKVNRLYDGENEKISNEGLGNLIEENSPSNDKYKTFAKENRELAENTIERIKRILEEKCGIKFNSKYDGSIIGAEMYDSGSTGRGTDIPTKDVDLDFTLLLDANDYNEKLKLIRETIYKETGTTNADGEGERTGGFQLKSKKNSIGQSDERPNGISLDLLVLKKSQVIDYSSSDAMKEKFDYIARNSKTGPEDLDRVRTNVIIMKKLLKAKGCYKKPEGGISGIGVENRITQHHGSFVEALESFERVAYGGEYIPGKNSMPLEEFKEQYPIFDAGENYKDGCNDNFVDKINGHGYNGILEIVRTLRLEGLEGIRRLIKEYEKKKSEFIG